MPTRNSEEPLFFHRDDFSVYDAWRLDLFYDDLYLRDSILMHGDEQVMDLAAPPVGKLVVIDGKPHKVKPRD